MLGLSAISRIIGVDRLSQLGREHFLAIAQELHRPRLLDSSLARRMAASAQVRRVASSGIDPD